MDKREDRPRPAQPTSSNTQLDECVRRQQLPRTGVDQDLAVTRKDKKNKIKYYSDLVQTACRYEHLAHLQGSSLQMFMNWTVSVDCLHQV